MKKQFYVQFKRIKGASLLGNHRIVSAKDKESAKRKFKRKFPLSRKPQITRVSEFK